MSEAMTIGDWVREASARPGGAAPWLVAGDPTSGRDLDARSERTAAGLRALGLQSGEHVAVLMRNSVAMLDVWFGLAKAGLVEVPINVGSGTVLLRYFVEQIRAPVVVCDAEFLDAVLDAVAGQQHVQRVLVHGGATREAPGVAVSDLADLPAEPGELPGVRPDDTTVVLYTSGTTGPPKGVKLSHRANLNLGRHTVDLMGYTAADRLYSVFPLFHSNARFTSVLPALEAGAGLVMHNRFSTSRFWDICREHDITAFNYQGAMLSMLHKQPPRPDDLDNPVRAAFGAPCPAEIWEPFERRFGLRLTEIYGSTEASIITQNPPVPGRVPGSAGRESPNWHVRVVDEDDRPVAAGTPGEMVARPSKPGWIFDGYLDMAEATVRSWRNLWFHTGDRGMLDADGWLFFLDRLSDSIRRRGENISSWEIERVVAEHPDVAAVAAYGVPSALSEDEVMIAVVAADGAVPDPAALVEHCRGTVTAFALPRYVRIVDALPLTPSQRTEKYRLRAEGVTPDAYDREATGG